MRALVMRLIIVLAIISEICSACRGTNFFVASPAQVSRWIIVIMYWQGQIRGAGSTSSHCNGART